ncbi:MAG: hypothetical protein ALECFALPRED_006110 [Alectoria fallacina]|uniref:Uncharacterized protein n=1 Tax=Alectoria fallacina TaxID=1903189 RepID=A0A8H3I757_9LECA|nr:MAG: hypothetical protein ALECFALPRED_006110 [Alectoria fallacina]
MDGSGRDNQSSQDKGKSNIPEGPGVDRQTTQPKENQHEMTSLKQDSPTDRSDSGTGIGEHHNPHGKHDKMARWLEETPREEPWSAVGCISRGHRGNE